MCIAQEGCDFTIQGKRINDSDPVTLDLNRITRRHLADGSIVEYRVKNKTKTNKPGPKPNDEVKEKDLIKALRTDSNATRGD